VYILARLFSNAFKVGAPWIQLHHGTDSSAGVAAVDEAWKQWMLLPADYAREALSDAATRDLMDKVSHRHSVIPKYR
jgi:hypothetical protein